MRGAIDKYFFYIYSYQWNNLCWSESLKIQLIKWNSTSTTLQNVLCVSAAYIYLVTAEYLNSDRKYWKKTLQQISWILLNQTGEKKIQKSNYR